MTDPILAVGSNGAPKGIVPCGAPRKSALQACTAQSLTPDQQAAAKLGMILDRVKEGADIIREQDTQPTDNLTELYNSSIVSPTEEIEPVEFLYRWDGVDFMPRQNVISLKAPAKSGKTFSLTAFAAAFLRGNFGELTSYAKPGERALFVDTEQARNSTRKVLRRIIKHAPDAADRLRVLNVRNVCSADRLKLVQLAVTDFKPVLIIVDGIADLIEGMDYNDQAAADKVITTLAALAEECNGVVIAAIHTNKNDATQATGWLGKILLQKCALEIGLKRKGTETTRTMEFVTRDREVPPITTSIEDTEDGLGEIRILSVSEAATNEADEQRAKYKTKLLEIGIEPPQRLKRAEFVKLVIKAKTIDETHPYNRNSAEKFVTRCIAAGALDQMGEYVSFSYD